MFFLNVLSKLPWCLVYPYLSGMLLYISTYIVHTIPESFKYKHRTIILGLQWITYQHLSSIIYHKLYHFMTTYIQYFEIKCCMMVFLVKMNMMVLKVENTYLGRGIMTHYLTPREYQSIHQTTRCCFKLLQRGCNTVSEYRWVQWSESDHLLL